MCSYLNCFLEGTLEKCLKWQNHFGLFLDFLKRMLAVCQDSRWMFLKCHSVSSSVLQSIAWTLFILTDLYFCCARSCFTPVLYEDILIPYTQTFLHKRCVNKLSVILVYRHERYWIFHRNDERWDVYWTVCYWINWLLKWLNWKKIIYKR